MSRCGFFHSTVKKCKVLFLALSLAVLFVLGMTTQKAYAALNCTTQPTCEELGYDKNYLACPFDSSYIKNLSDKNLIPSQKSCAEMGFTTDDKSSWCPADQIVSCCDSEDDPKGTYTLCASVSCADLGYTTDEKTECSEDELETCPFDETYTRCPGSGLGKSCEELGYTQGDKTSWCDAESILTCPSDETLTLCVKPSKCIEGYAKTVEECGQTGSEGWKLGTNKFFDCTECVAKGVCDIVVSCPAGQEKVPDGFSGDRQCYKCQDIACPDGSSVETTCSGNSLPVANGSYSGSQACYECKACSMDYATNVDFCGYSGSRGWTLSSSDKDTIGCKKCVANECPGGGEVGKTCLAGQTRVTTGYSGNALCYRCDGDPTVVPEATCESAGCAKGQYLCSGKCTSYASSPDCEYCTGETSQGGSSTGGGNSCDPLMMTECEYKICVDSNYCVTGAGSGGMDPMCCEIDKEEGSVGGLDPEKPFG